MMELVLENDTILYSPEDHDLISKYKWNVKGGYALSTVGNYRMHRLIMIAETGVKVDHINSNKLDNHRENLRLANSQQNAQNVSKRTNTTSKFLGVYYSNRQRKFVSNISVNNKHVYIGSYNNEIDAARARDLFIVHEIPNFFHKLNFPNDLEFYKTCEYIARQTISKKPKPKRIFRSFYENTEDDAVVRLLMPTKPDLCILINKTDYETIKYNTYVLDNVGYVKTTNVDCGCHLLHRFIMNATDPQIYIDHIDGNKLNNVRNNLRFSNSKLNMQNQQKRGNTSSKYMGVSYDKKRGKWESSITVNNKKIYIGRFLNERLAALKRDVYIMKNLTDSHYNFNYRIMNNEYLAKNNINVVPVKRISVKNLIDDTDDEC